MEKIRVRVLVGSEAESEGENNALALRLSSPPRQEEYINHIVYTVLDGHLGRLEIMANTINMVITYHPRANAFEPFFLSSGL